ncbi:conserved hypothetical protein [Mucor ambiguus]|uniref:DUF7719 domain-containing protein n=1 Tax=Mucor ambiguus TaxID=91626 RepID=A0A0C9MFC9_9FUNG|nr:conserved hypothetical protein [Mucor ambiguus]
MSNKKQQGGIKPSQFKGKASKEPLISKIPSQPSDGIPDDEKLRLIDQTGLMKKVKQRESELMVKKQATTAEYIWQAIFLSIPFGFLMATFDVTVKVQYSEPWNYAGIVTKCAKSAPALAPFIYLTNRYKSTRLTQVLMAFGSAIVGSFLMYTLRHSPSLGQMMRAPGLATVWIYFIVQLDLIPATVTLTLVALYWYFGLRV